MALLGLDVGFSAKRPSSGVASLLSTGELILGHTTSDWASRSALVGSERLLLAAIDAPYTTAPDDSARRCERVLSLGQFQRKCKPAYSHIPGAGQRLRAAGGETAEQLMAIAPSRPVASDFPRVQDCNIIEAFPNAYLGVCLPAAAYRSMPKLRRGRKFDWLYEQWAKHDLFRRTSSAVRAHVAHELVTACERNTQHDERAALVCLLTAAGVANGNYTALGDPDGGYIFLPPWRNWARWAREAIDANRKRVPNLEVWSSGVLHLAEDALPG